MNCKKCAHNWILQTAVLPRRCPKCRSRRWNGVDKRKGNKGAPRRNRMTKWGWEKMKLGEVKKINYQGWEKKDFDLFYQSMYRYNKKAGVLITWDKTEGKQLNIVRLK